MGVGLGALGPGMVQDVLGCRTLGRVDVEATSQQIC